MVQAIEAEFARRDGAKAAAAERREARAAAPKPERAPREPRTPREPRAPRKPLTESEKADAFLADVEAALTRR